MIRAFTRHLTRKPSIVGTGGWLVIPMALGMGFACTCIGASADADRGFRPTEQAPAGLDASRINPLAKGTNQ